MSYKKQSGANMVEYALILLVIVLGCMPAIVGFANQFGSNFGGTIGTAVQAMENP